MMEDVMGAARQETMLRKPILMPPGMIKKVDKIARKKKVSFAKVVREAVDAFDDGMIGPDKILLEALADTMLASSRELARRIGDIERRLDETHAILAGS
jgi:hypothetical protein